MRHQLRQAHRLPNQRVPVSHAPRRPGCATGPARRPGHLAAGARPLATRPFPARSRTGPTAGPGFPATIPWASARSGSVRTDCGASSGDVAERAATTYRDRKYHCDGTRRRGSGRTWIAGGNGRQPRQVVMRQANGGWRYQAMTLAELARLLLAASRSDWWRLVAEFHEEYRWEPVDLRHRLLATEPASTGDERWDVLLAALAEHLAARDSRGAPAWSEPRQLRRFWFPFQHSCRARRRGRPRAGRIPASRRLCLGP